MQRSLPVLMPKSSSRTCVWSDAGVLSFRLCDRAFACDRCPLDAALRGDARACLSSDEPLQDGRPSCAWTFPADRLYADGHLWVQIISAGRVRLGVDACVALLARPVLAVRPAGQSRIARGDALCALCLGAGELPILSPLAGRARAWNDRLISEPSLLCSDPYAAGWIAEIDHPTGAGLDLQRSDAAAIRARLVVRRFGRRSAFSLLSAPESTWEEPGLVEAARRALGSSDYFEIVREVLR